MSVHAQAVVIRIDIPAGVNFNAQVTEPMEGGTWENRKAKLWMEIEAQENLTLLLDIVYPDREILPLPEADFLNDGTNDFEKAIKLGGGTQRLRMSNDPNLIRTMDPRPTSLQAWLGIPVLNGISIKIEYP